MYGKRQEPNKIFHCQKKKKEKKRNNDKNLEKLASDVQDSGLGQITLISLALKLLMCKNEDFELDDSTGFIVYSSSL